MSKQNKEKSVKKIVNLKTAKCDMCYVLIMYFYLFILYYYIYTHILQYCRSQFCFIFVNLSKN